MIIGMGSDLIDIRRIEKSLERFGERFTQRCFTEIERTKSDRRRNRAASHTCPPLRDDRPQGRRCRAHARDLRAGPTMNRAALACWILILAALTFFATISPAALAAGVAVTVAARTAGHLSGRGDAGR